MNIKSSLVSSFTRVVKKFLEITESTPNDRYNSDIVLAMALQKVSSREDIHFPVDYVGMLRDCMQKTWLNIQAIKTDSGKNDDISIKRFSSLVDALRHVPSIEFSAANEIALVADSYRGEQKVNHEKERVYKHDVYDLRSHFEISSSFGKKGRILNAVVRFSQSKHCLELGTAYGMSALFILQALKRQGADAHLTTLEGGKQQFIMSSKTLRSLYGNQVSCEFGRTRERLSEIVQSIDGLDFLFHDAGHCREDYVWDFQTVLPALRPGAVVLIDDIRWDDSRFVEEDPRCYEGWREVVSHQRVRQAVEISGEMGLLLLGE